MICHISEPFEIINMGMPHIYFEKDQMSYLDFVYSGRLVLMKS